MASFPAVPAGSDFVPPQDARAPANNAAARIMLKMLRIVKLKVFFMDIPS